MASAIAMPKGSPLEVRLAVDVGQPHKRRHIASSAEQRQCLAAAPGRSARHELTSEGSAASAGRSGRRRRSKFMQGDPPRAAFGGLQQHLVAFPASRIAPPSVRRPRRRAAPSSVRRRRRSPGSSAGGSHRAMNHRAADTDGKAGRDRRELAVEHREVRADERAQRSGHPGLVIGWCCQKIMRPRLARADAANIAWGQAPWNTTARDRASASNCGERAPGAPHHQGP